MASETASWGEEDADTAQDEQVQLSEEQVDNTIAQDSFDHGDTAENGTEDDSGDYDPESVTIGTPAQVPEKAASATPSQRAPPKPNMSGGFIVEASDDDDEDEDEEPDTEPPAAEPVATYDNVDPPQTSHEIDLPLPVHSAQADPIGAHPALVGLDPVTLLGARVKEDPRGDMDAWLNLIAEHRRSGRIDQVRATYNRFLENFPQAVSCATNSSFINNSIDSA